MNAMNLRKEAPLSLGAGISASVLVSRTNPEGCTNHGASSRQDRFTCFGDADIEQAKACTRDADAVLIICRWHGFYKAVPIGLYLSGLWPMFGGNFITGDSSMPQAQDGWNHPIPVHDRVE